MPLLPLSREGCGPPVFVLPGAAQTPLSLLALARAFRGERPVFGYLYPGLENDDAVQTRVENIADDVVRGVGQLLPGGRCIVFGQCFGGLVAFASTRTLIRNGDHDPALVLMDTQATGAMDDFEANQMTLPGNDLQRLSEAARERFNHAWNSHNAAALRYSPVPTSCHALYLATGPTRHREIDDWQRLCTGCMGIRRLSGNSRDTVDAELAGAVVKAINSHFKDGSERPH